MALALGCKAKPSGSVRISSAILLRKLDSIPEWYEAVQGCSRYFAQEGLG
jgi:hypothetical protein